MLHIILLLLKIIGWILLLILGILILAVLFVLFSAGRYQAEASADGPAGSFQGKGSFSWLFGVLRGSFGFSGDGWDFEVRFFQKRLLGTEAAEEEEMPGEEEMPEEPGIPCAPDLSEEPGREEREERPEISGPEPDFSGQKEPDGQSALLERKENGPKRTGPESEKAAPKRRKGFFTWLKNRCRKTWKTVLQFFQRIKYTRREICDKINALSEKKDLLEGFLSDEIHIAAFYRCIRELKRLLRFLDPRELKADIRFGFEDPSVTGKVLAASAILYPLAEGRVVLEPDFGQAVFEGSIFVKGRVRLVYFGIVILHLLLDRNIWTTYKNIRILKRKMS